MSELKIGDYVEWLHGLPFDDIVCEKGRIIEIKLKYPGTKLEKIFYKVCFLRGVFKEPLWQVHELEVEADSLVIWNP